MVLDLLFGCAMPRGRPDSQKYSAAKLPHMIEFLLRLGRRITGKACCSVLVGQNVRL